MKEQDSIPASKVQRATKFVKTGVKVGGNYLTHYTKKVFNKDLDRSELDRKNAEDIYEGLSELKGSALKVAQMISMDKGMLPREYVQKFTMAQYSAPPLSGPLVMKTLRSALGKSPEEVFDKFDLKAKHAASIGQVHEAWLNGRKMAVKVQYPGVAESVKSDLRMVRPIAARVMRTKEKDIKKYFEEVEERLLEETDYKLELENSLYLSENCKHIPNLFFAEYLPELSSDRVLTMTWMEGQHLPEFLPSNPSQEIRNQIGQALYDFINYQMHTLGRVHADPHPGNYLMTEDGRLGVLDFGCVKVIPLEFYRSYFSVVLPEVRNNPERLLQTAVDLELLLPNDSEKERTLILDLLGEFLDIVRKPFFSETFYFGDDNYITSLYDLGMKVGDMQKEFGSNAARGTQHALYINRTFFGLYSLLNEIKAEINTGGVLPQIRKAAGIAEGE